MLAANADFEFGARFAPALYGTRPELPERGRKVGPPPAAGILAPRR